MAPAPDKYSAPGAVKYDSDTMNVGDGTWDFSKNTFLLPNLQGNNFDTMRYNGMGNRFSTLTQYHTIILAHAILAAIIFLFLVPIAVMLARFYSRNPGYAVKYHAQMQVFACILLIPVFALGFFAVGPERNLSNPHHGIGVAIFVLFLLQIIGGRLVRHITKLRSLRIVIHQWSGRAITILGIVQVPLGLTLYGSPKYLFVLYAVWMSFLVLLYFIFSYRSEGRRELYMSGARSDGGHTRITESEYFSDHKSHHGGKAKWLGPLAAGAGIWALMRGRKKDKARDRSRSRSRSFSRSRRGGPEVIASRRGSGSFVDEKYSEVRPKHNSGGGMMKMFGGAAAALGAGKLVSSFMNRREKNHDEEYSAVSTETPRRHRSGRGLHARSDFSSELTEDMTQDGTQSSLLPPSAHPAGRAFVAGGRPVTPRASHARDHSRRDDFEDSEYSSYVSPSRRQQDGKSGGGFAKGILGGLGMGWIAKKMADRRAKKEEDRMRLEDDMRSGTGTQASRFTGDGFPSPSRTQRRPPPPPGWPTGPGRDTALSDVTESSFESRPPGGTYAQPMPPLHSGIAPVPVPIPSGHHGSRAGSRPPTGPLSMPSMPDDPHGVLHSGGESSFVTDNSRPGRRMSSRRRRAGERAAAAAAARAGGLAMEEESRGHRSDRERERYGSPHSQPVSVKLKMHDDKDRNVTLRRLTEEEARAARGRSRADSESSMSALESPSAGRRYRRDSSQRRAERSAERRVEDDRLAPLSPPNPAFAKGKGKRGKDSAYYSGQPGPSGSTPMAGQTVSTLNSPESNGTWSAMSLSPSGPHDKPSDSAAADNRRRRRQERRRASSSRPSGTDMFE